MIMVIVIVKADAVSSTLERDVYGDQNGKSDDNQTEFALFEFVTNQSVPI